ncbi:hypothetical protein [Corynebacterium sp. HS2168-gen11]|uniref:hypothetical protein n=1 Tax=Corynebacterium sp. HS2168-gen11 TaxID=2974027 RepID=UPI00216B61D4|nr:hypothetical protein [Corynebacterium sp. HS2168-gen11]MCS4535472.1 hypothetical protein [Corynebacterium sp. HS2168-gen11]
MDRLYIRLDLEVPGAGSTTHIAELDPISSEACNLLRIVELDPAGTVQGMATPEKTLGITTPPQPVVPHPNQYGNFPDIKTQAVTETEFEELWEQALTQFPNF